MFHAAVALVRSVLEPWTVTDRDTMGCGSREAEGEDDDVDADDVETGDRCRRPMNPPNEAEGVESVLVRLLLFGVAFLLLLELPLIRLVRDDAVVLAVPRVVSPPCAVVATAVVPEEVGSARVTSPMTTTTWADPPGTADHRHVSLVVEGMAVQTPAASVVEAKEDEEEEGDGAEYDEATGSTANTTAQSTAAVRSTSLEEWAQALAMSWTEQRLAFRTTTRRLGWIKKDGCFVLSSWWL